jgi:hypothetical protein
MRAIGLLLLTIICLAAWPAAVGAEGAAAVVELPLGPLGPAGHQAQMVISPEGQVLVNWLRRPEPTERAEQVAPRLASAAAPDWDLLALPFTLPEAPAQLRMVSTASSRFVAYMASYTRTQEIICLDRQGVAPPQRIEHPYTYRWANYVSSQGDLHVAWAAEGGLVYVNAQQMVTLSLTLPLTVTVGALDLAVGAEGPPALTWEQRDPEGASVGIYWAAMVSGTVPVPIALQGYAPRIAVGPTGQVHAAWLSPDGLVYANSSAWSVVQPVAPLGTNTPFALAVGSDDRACLVWPDGDALWCATSSDWSTVVRLETLATAPIELYALVDSQGRLHVMWTGLTNDGELASYYRVPRLAGPQLRVTSSSGNVISGAVQAVAQTTLASSEMERVEFYLQLEDGLDTDVARQLLALGVDRDGRDGWSTSWQPASLPLGQYRVLALAVARDGQILRATGERFMGGMPAWPWLAWPTVQSPPLARTGHVDLAFPLGAQPVASIGLYLCPLGAPAVPDITDLAALLATARYVGAYTAGEATVERGIVRLGFDTRRLPDGTYGVLLALGDPREEQHWKLLGHSIAIDNTLAPTVTLLRPRAGDTLLDTMTLSARATDADGVVQRVAFYLESPGGQQTGGGQVGDRRIWLGSDDDGSDGWGLTCSIESAWEGDSWQVRALAWDDEQQVSLADVVGPLHLATSQQLGVRLVSPPQAAVVSGTVRIELAAVSRAADLRSARLYLRDDSGMLAFLGEASASATSGRWVLDWDSTQWPDGSAEIVALASDGAASQAVAGQSVRLANGPSLVVSERDGGGCVGPSTVSVRLAPNAQAADIRSATFWLQDAQQRLTFLGRDEVPDNGVGILVNPREALDGPARVVAELGLANGRELWVEQAVCVSAHSPAIRLKSSLGREPLTGIQTLDWQASGADGGAPSVQVDYSSDGGREWQTVATNLPATGPWGWDTTRWPDSPSARLRLTASQGDYTTVVETDPLVLANRNAPPWVTLLSPKPGAGYAQVVHLAWQAGDSEDDQQVVVALDYRRPDGPWQPISGDLPATGAIDWDLGGLLPDKGYQVRARATDAAGLQASDQVSSVAIVSNTPPVVRLLWPIGQVMLENDTVLLWQASDRDGDPLAIDLYYSYDAGLTWFPLAENVANTGFYEWQLAFLPPSDQYRVRVVARDERAAVSDESAVAFSVGQRRPEVVQLLDPRAEQQVRGLVLVRWALASGAAGGARVTLSVRPQKGTEWAALAQDMIGSGALVWDTASLTDGAYELLAVANDSTSGTRSSSMLSVNVDNSSGQLPEVEVLWPRGGELAYGIQRVAWALDGPKDAPLTAVIAVRESGQADWRIVGRADAWAGSYAWDTTAQPSGHYYEVRVTVQGRDKRTAAAVSGPVFVGNTAGYPPSLVVISPDASGALLQGDTIAWLAEDVDGDMVRLDIDTAQQGAGQWLPVVRDLYNAGEYVLKAGLAPRATTQLLLTAQDGLYRLGALTTTHGLSAPDDQMPTIDVQQPQSWASLAGEITLAWQAKDPYGAIPRVHIELSADGGLSWRPLARNLESAGSYAWDTAQWANGTYLARFVSDNGRLQTNLLKGPFELANPGGNAPVVSLLAPRGGEAWSGHQEVRWRAWDADGDALTYALAYRLAGESQWHMLAQDLPATGRYLVDTSVMPNAERVWLRIEARDGHLVGLSETTAPFAVGNARLPSIELLAPVAGQVVAGVQTVAWRATSGPVAIEYSLDEGATWQMLAEEQPAQGSLSWDTATLRTLQRVLLRATARLAGRTVRGVLSAPVLVVGNQQESWLPLYIR